jgi:uncharacterized protein (DUF2235 family)
MAGRRAARPSPHDQLSAAVQGKTGAQTVGEADSLPGADMAKNIVICADGTGNSFKRSVSNVPRMVRLLTLDDHARQVVVYDQGIGTDGRRWKEIVKFRQTIRDPKALRVLPGPQALPPGRRPHLQSS